MSPMSTADLHRIFDLLDENGDGLVSLDELMGFLKKIGFHTTLEELGILAGKQGLDPIDFLFFHDNVINRRLHGSQKGEVADSVAEKDLLQAFGVFDSNGDGFISCEELQNALAKMGLWDQQCGKDCKSMIQEYDTNSDGKLDFEEFKNMMFLSDP